MRKETLTVIASFAFIMVLSAVILSFLIPDGTQQLRFITEDGVVCQCMWEEDGEARFGECDNSLKTKDVIVSRCE